MKMRYLLIFAILLLSIVAFSETTKNKCFIKDHISGNNIIELNSNVTIYASDPTNGWCKTRLFIIIDKSFIENVESIIEGAIIKDYYRKSPMIGKILEKLIPFEIFTREDGNYEALIDGYISYDDLEIKSIPERALENIISSNISFGDPKLIAFTKEFGFNKRGDIEGYHYWELYDLMPEEGGIRIGLFFDKNNYLVAIMNNKRFINYMFAKSFKVERNYQLHLVQANVSDKLLEKLKAKIQISD